MLRYTEKGRRKGVMVETLARYLALMFPSVRGLAFQKKLRVARQCELRRYSPGEHLFRKGESAREFFLLLEGEVPVCICRSTFRMYTVGARDGCAWDHVFVY